MMIREVWRAQREGVSWFNEMTGSGGRMEEEKREKKIKRYELRSHQKAEITALPWKPAKVARNRERSESSRSLCG